MASTFLPNEPCPVGPDLIRSMTDALAGQVRRWSAECQKFLEWQRKQLAAGILSDQLRADNEAALCSLLALGRILNAATSAPDFPDPHAAQLVKGRIAQLQHSWEINHPTMSEHEAEAFLKEHFEPDPR